MNSLHKAVDIMKERGRCMGALSRTEEDQEGHDLGVCLLGAIAGSHNLLNVEEYILYDVDDNPYPDYVSDIKLVASVIRDQYPHIAELRDNGDEVMLVYGFNDGLHCVGGDDYDFVTDDQVFAVLEKAAVLKDEIV